MKLFIVTPYESMVTVINKIIKEFSKTKIEYTVGDLNEGVKSALKAEKDGFDAIISRGGTAQMIQEYVSIPVIDMKLSGYDILRTIILASNQGKETALIGFSNITTGAHAIIDLLNLSINIYTINNSNELNTLLLELKNTGIDYVIGDVITTKKAKDFNINYLLLQSGEETLRAAVKQAYYVIAKLGQDNLEKNLIEKSFNELTKDYMLLDTNQIVKSQFTYFSKEILSKEKLLNIINELNRQVEDEFSTFYFDDINTQVKATRFVYLSTDYFLLLFYFIDQPIIKLSGIYRYQLENSFKNVTKSNAMKKVEKEVSQVLSNKQILYLLGNDYVTESNIVENLAEKLDGKYKILEIYPDQLSLSEFYEYSFTEYQIFIFKETKYSSKLMELLSLLHSNNKTIVIVERKSFDDAIINQPMVYPLRMPCIRERSEDLTEIAEHFIVFYHNNYGTKPVKINEETICFLFNNDKYKAIGKYLSMLKRALYQEVKFTVTKDTLIQVIQQYDEEKYDQTITSTDKTLQEIEIGYVKKILEEEEFNQTRAAKRLGISRATLWRKMKNNQI